MKRTLGLILLTAISAISSADVFPIHPFSTDKVIRADKARLHYYFELPKGIALNADAAFWLDYETSAGLATLQGNMTVLLNGEPIGSRSMTDVSQSSQRWNVGLPKKFIKVGFNELTIASQTKSTEGPCRDDDDLRNWVRIFPSSVLRVDLANQSPFPLVAYPYPYINWLSQTATSMPIVVSANATESTLSAALNLSSGFGKRLPDKPLEVRLSHNPVGNLNIRFGLASDLGNLAPKTNIEARGDGLWLSAANPSALGETVSTLNNPLMTAQMNGFAANASNFVPKPTPAATRIGIATFSELGFPGINLNGIGTQTASLVLHRPLLIPLGRGGELRLKYRHAATLMRARSLLSVTVNDQPIASANLNPENANDGELICSLPIEIVDSNEWRIQITAHNELANADCSKSYDDVAWTNILGSSSFQLHEGALPNTPYLDGFPYLRGRDGKLPENVTMNFGSQSTEAILTLAATTAARSSQTNRTLTHWALSTAGLSGNEDVVIGYLNEEDRFKSIASRLLIVPNKNGIPTISKEVAVLPSSLVDAVVVQAIPKSSGGASYVILGASDEAIKRFTEYISSLPGFNSMSGQVAVFTKQGEMFVFDTVTQSDRLAAEDNEMSRYRPSMTLTMSIVGGIFVLLLIFIASKFVKRKPKK